MRLVIDKRVNVGHNLLGIFLTHLDLTRVNGVAQLTRNHVHFHLIVLVRLNNFKVKLLIVVLGMTVSEGHESPILGSLINKEIVRQSYNGVFG